MAEPTRLDPHRDGLGDAAATRLDDAAATRLDDADATRLDGAARDAAAAPGLGDAQRRLPAELGERFEVQWQFPAGGAEADVYRVLDRTSQATLVLKVYRYGLRPKAEVLQRLSREPSGHVIGLLEHGEAGGLSYELLEHARYGSLRMLMRASAPGPAAVSLALETARQLHAALIHLHERHVVHRDLKPENVLVRSLDPLGLALTDFGISSVLEFSQKVTGVARSLRYGAPEAASGAIGESVDWWSLGVILVEVLTGRHPYEGLSDVATLREQMTKDIDVAGVADDRLRALCRGLTQRDPELRWGGDLVGRWLRGDELPAPAPVAEVAAAEAAGSRPYSFRGEHYFTAKQLVRAFAANRAEAVKHWRRGLVLPWLREDLKDEALTDLARRLPEIEEKPAHQLLRFIHTVDPGLPLVYEGLEITPSELDAVARQALAGAQGSPALLAAIFREDLLRFAPTQELRELRMKWKAAAEGLGADGADGADPDVAIVTAYAASRDFIARAAVAETQGVPVASPAPRRDASADTAPDPAWSAKLRALAALPLPRPAATDPMQQAQAASLEGLRRQVEEAVSQAPDAEPAERAEDAARLAAQFRHAHAELRQSQAAAFAGAVRRTLDRAHGEDDDSPALALNLAWKQLELPASEPSVAAVTELLGRLVSAELIISEARERANRPRPRWRRMVGAIGHAFALVIILPGACTFHQHAFIRGYERFDECRRYACVAADLVPLLIVGAIYGVLGFYLPARARARQKRLVRDARGLIARLLEELHAAADAIESGYRGGRDLEIDRLLEGVRA